MALRKSGVSNEYIEELDKMLVDEINKLDLPTKCKKTPRKLQLKRNYRGGSKQRFTSETIQQDPTNKDMGDNINATTINLPFIDSSVESGIEGNYNSQGTDRSGTAPGGSYMKADSKEAAEPASKQTTCAHWLCLLCCCAYCAFLSGSTQRQLGEN